jgi:hypothetical protein
VGVISNTHSAISCFLPTSAKENATRTHQLLLGWPPLAAQFVEIMHTLVRAKTIMQASCPIVCQVRCGSQRRKCDFSTIYESPISGTESWGGHHTPPMPVEKMHLWVQYEVCMLHCSVIAHACYRLAATGIDRRYGHAVISSVAIDDVENSHIQRQSEG